MVTSSFCQDPFELASRKSFSITLKNYKDRAAFTSREPLQLLLNRLNYYLICLLKVVKVQKNNSVLVGCRTQSCAVNF